MRDIDVRKVLLEVELASFRSDGESRIVEELCLCQGAARVDVAVVNGLMHGYEIKSKNDTLNRLSGQIEVYSKVLDRCTIVIEESHLDKALPLIPQWWGVITVWESNGEIRMATAKRPTNNPNPEPYALAQFLWLNEALLILEKHGLNLPGIEKKARRFLWKRLADNLDYETLSLEVRTTLKERNAWRVGSQQIQRGGSRPPLPKSSNSQCFQFPLRTP